VQRPTAQSPTPRRQFQLNNQGTLTTVEGDPVIPTITIPPNSTAITITQYGVVNATLPDSRIPRSWTDSAGYVSKSRRSGKHGLESVAATLSSGDPVLGNPGGTRGWAHCSKTTWKTRM